MLVLTIDQRGSRRKGDRVDGLLDQLHGRASAHRFVRLFERTAGDEIQGLLESPELAVDIALRLMRTGDWYIGVGIGTVLRPIPMSVRAATGAAFFHAREAVERAKRHPQRVAINGPDRGAASDAESLLQLLGAVVRRRTRSGWEVVELMDEGFTQKQVAHKLGITPQAVSQRLGAAFWQLECRNRPLAARLLARAGREEHVPGPGVLPDPVRAAPARLDGSIDGSMGPVDEHLAVERRTVQGTSR